MFKHTCKNAFFNRSHPNYVFRPDTKYIYVNVGFGFHVQFTLEEAKTFIEKKEKQLQSLADKHSTEADKIRAHIKMVKIKVSTHTHTLLLTSLLLGIRGYF